MNFVETFYMSQDKRHSSTPYSCLKSSRVEIQLIAFLYQQPDITRSAVVTVSANCF